MAEEQQDDLSMEDILSSIKDILNKDSAEQPASVSEVRPEPVVAQPEVSAVAVEPEAEDDVYDLSAAMIIDDPLAETAADDIDLKLDDVDLTIKDVTADLAAEDINIPEIAAEPVFEPEVSVSDELPELSLDDEAEPIFSPEEDAAGELRLPQDSVDVGALLDVSAEKEEIEEPAASKGEDIAENIDDILNSASKVIYADNNEEKAVAVSSADVSAEEGDAADVSAGIISNFAKMFAEKAPVEQVSLIKEHKPEPEAVKLLGNGSRTIENVVEDVIKSIIGEAVSAELNGSVNIEDYAKEEIKKQTKAWLEAKLPSVVEAAVQKEIERVMAKVGR